MPTRVTFLAIGSRGDVEPMAILAGALVARGVPATVVAVDDYAELVRSRLVTLLHTAILPTTHRESHLEGRWFLGWRWRDRLVTQWYWETTSGLSRATSTAMRSSFGLPRMTARESTAAADRERIMVAADPTLLPSAPDWPQTCRQTSAITADVPTDWTPPEQLEAFLAAGSRPVFVGLGSLNDTGGRRWLDLIEEAARLSGRRVVTPALRGAGPAVLGGRVCTVADLPHGWLFPRMAGVIHHGGAGTTAAGLRAGVPSTTAPAMFDQYYHARRLAELGVGPRHVPLHRLNAGRLAGLVVSLAGGSYTARAAAVGAQVRAVDGLSRTLAVLDLPAGTGGQ